MDVGGVQQLGISVSSDSWLDDPLSGSLEICVEIEQLWGSKRVTGMRC